MTNNNFASIVIHFDSLDQSLSLIGNNDIRLKSADPAYFEIADRFFALAEKYKIKFTIFVIGKDLECPEIFEQVRIWHSRGHEIGNHSYNHIHNLGRLSCNIIENEVMRSHDIITRCTGREPKGFAAPAWNISRKLVNVLIKANYLYDASMFPSYFIQLFSLKSLLTSARKKRFGPFSRSDKLLGFFGNRNFRCISALSLLKSAESGLMEFPVPTAKFLRIPCYHSMYFIFGRKIFDRLIKHCLQSNTFFQYVMHPLDLFDADKDIRNIPNLKINKIERAGVPLGTKKDFADSALNIVSRNRKCITLERMAEKVVPRGYHN